MSVRLDADDIKATIIAFKPGRSEYSAGAKTKRKARGAVTNANEAPARLLNKL